MGICGMTQGIKVGLCDNLEGWDGREVWEGGDTGVPTENSC